MHHVSGNGGRKSVGPRPRPISQHRVLRGQSTLPSEQLTDFRDCPVPTWTAALNDPGMRHHEGTDRVDHVDVERKATTYSLDSYHRRATSLWEARSRLHSRHVLITVWNL